MDSNDLNKSVIKRVGDRKKINEVNSSAKPPAMPGRMAKAMLQYLT